MNREKIFKITDQHCIEYVNDFKSISKFVPAFKKEFSYIRAFHATNLNEQEIADIRKNGIKTSSGKLLCKMALARFVAPTDNEELKKSIAEEIDRFIASDDYICATEINLGLERQPFIDEWYQYLLFGSESLLGLATDLRRKHNINFRERMRDHGSHYIIEAIVPVISVKRIWIEAIYEYLNNGFPECALVYHKNLPSSLLKIKKVKTPFDRKGMLYC